MTDSKNGDSKTWEQLVEEGYYPERCPICGRINARSDDDYCEHYWGTVYDGALIDGPYAEEFAEAWSALENTYQTPDDTQAFGFLRRLREAGLEDIAAAVVDGDKLWWLSDVKDKVFIDAEASLASGTGWSLYHKQRGWFQGTLERLRRAAEIGGQLES